MDINELKKNLKLLRKNNMHNIDFLNMSLPEDLLYH